MGIRLESEGSFKNTQSFLDRCASGDYMDPVAAIAEEGVQRLAAATPQDDGSTAASWGYEIMEEGGKTTIWFTNSSVNEGFNIAVGLQYGHATGTGGWVGGIDYINPALRPIFDKMADQVWKEVAK
jgi:hypothetical protein